MIGFGVYAVVTPRGRAVWLITGVVAAVLVGGCVAEQPPSTSPTVPSAAPSMTPVAYARRDADRDRTSFPVGQLVAD